MSTPAKKLVKKLLKFFSLIEDIPSYYISGARKKIRIDEDIPGFSMLAKKIRAEGRTMLEYDRLYTLWQCIAIAPINTNMMEVGVYKGGSTKFISEADLMINGESRGTMIHSIDTFKGHVSVVKGIDGDHEEGKGFADVDFKDVAVYLKNQPNVTLVKGDIEDVAVDLGDDMDLGFVHVDVDVYLATLFSLKYAAKRLVPGGIIVVDDYGFTTCKGAKQAVSEFLKSSKDFKMFHLLTGQCVIWKETSMSSDEKMTLFDASVASPRIQPSF